jgi:hypothetical protein
MCAESMTVVVVNATSVRVVVTTPPCMLSVENVLSVRKPSVADRPTRILSLYSGLQPSSSEAKPDSRW